MQPKVSGRRATATVRVGNILIGSRHPIVVQSMTNTDTADAKSTAIQVSELARAGSELVRITVNTLEAAQAVPAPGAPTPDAAAPETAPQPDPSAPTKPGTPAGGDAKGDGGADEPAA